MSKICHHLSPWFIRKQMRFDEYLNVINVNENWHTYAK